MYVYVNSNLNILKSVLKFILSIWQFNFLIVILEPVYEEACFRVPILNQVDIQKYVSGPDTFTPDGQWILGETAEVMFITVLF